ncbi:hypothetical protein D2V04_01550 [Pelagerythrobacter aerophilus]|uniref:Uncharacterized protein n=2 Tax=Pelagerythrobacter aerophilus TaxID=2306995 RepID=A0A418NE64_9SPHN|nr:hypothetical protein D2V04_17575 [Pelagerythrobacter aerophilus]RIV80697.1 hypothetical protein D2V04_01550 [Pelagerythrobacter aerophilus]
MSPPMEIGSFFMALAAQADPWIVRIAAEWIGWKFWLSDWTGISHSILHAYFGLLLQVLAAAFMRRGLASAWPWLFVFALEIGNELLDWSRALTYGTAREGLVYETISDILFTMVLPTVLLILARSFPRLGLGERTVPVAEACESD